MKLCKLKLKNLNSFRREIEINFEQSPLAEASLVAITGPTGAGKTTLLDADLRCLIRQNTAFIGEHEARHPSHLLSHGETNCLCRGAFCGKRGLVILLSGA